MKLRSLIVSSFTALALTACNAGSTLPTPSTVSTPSGTSTSSPSQVTLTNVPSGQQETLSAINGVTPTLTLPTFSTPFSGTVSESSTLPSTVTTFSLPLRTQTLTKQSTVANSTPLLYVAVTPSATTTATGTMTASFLLSSTPVSGTSYYLAFFNGTSWDATDYATAGTVSGNTVTFTGSLPTAGITLNANTNYAIVLYSLSSSSGTGTSASSGTVTPGTALTGTFLDGTSASLTLPSVSGASAGTYTAYTSASSLTSSLPGTQLPTTGTFAGGATVTSPSAFSLPSGSLLSYTVTPSSTPYGQTLTLYYVTSASAPVALAPPQSLSSAGTPATGTISVPSTLSIPAGGTYTFVAYEQ